MNVPPLKSLIGLLLIHACHYAHADKLAAVLCFTNNKETPGAECNR